jgi:hypothetical protein
LAGVDDKVRAFLEEFHGAVMATIRADGSAHVARVGIGLYEGKLWSSATQTRVRTKHLRRDRVARCSCSGGILSTGWVWIARSKSSMATTLRC